MMHAQSQLLVRTQSYSIMPVLLMGVILLALAVRFAGLTAYGVWFDEAYHVQLVRMPSVGAMLEAVLLNPPSDPLYALVLRGWTALFGTGDAAIRTLSVLFGAATVPATYMLGVYAAGRSAAVAAAVFFALSPYAVEFGQEAALYGLAALLTTLALGQAWRWLRTGEGKWLYVVLGILAVYSHYVVGVIVFLLAVFLARRFNREGRGGKWLLANSLIFLAWLPWLAAMGYYWATSVLTRTSLPHTATWQEVGGALVQFTSGSASLQQGNHLLWAVGLVGGAVLLGGGLASGKSGVYALGAISLLVFIPPAVISAITGRWLFVPHFMIFLLPALFVCLASAIYIAAHYRTRLVSALVTGGVLIWLGAQVWGLALYYRYPPHGADGLRELADVLAKGAQPQDVVFVTPPPLMPTLQQYFPGETVGLPENFSLRRVYIPYNADSWHTQSLDEIDEQLRVKKPRHVWLVYRPELDKEGKLLSYMRGKYGGVLEKEAAYAALYLFRIPER